MPYCRLYIDVDLVGVKKIIIQNEPELSLLCTVECSKCQHRVENAPVLFEDEYESDDGRSTVNWSAQCKDCKTKMRIAFVPLSSALKEGLIKGLAYNLPIAHEITAEIRPLERDDWKTGQPPPSQHNALFALLKTQNCIVTDYLVNDSFIAHDIEGSVIEIGELTADGFFDASESGEAVTITLEGYRVE